ncbi:MAG: helix-turn-helix domain-containing protein [Ruminococcus sp.]
MNKISENIESLLELEGVNAKGYGIISQAVMFDRDISATSKTIYAYLCSYLGAGRTIFPKVTTILSDLKIAKNTFYKHFNALLENGYIKRSKAKGFLNRNIYIICNNVKKLKTPVFTSQETESQLALDGINASGYGFVPKLIMTDKRLSVKAKALIAFLYSIAQADSCAYPHRLTICTFLQMSKDLYYKALNQLIEYNYITVHQRHNAKGHFSVNDYILNSNPKVKVDEPCPDFCDYGENGLNSGSAPCPDFCDYGKSGINSNNQPCPENCDYGDNNRVLKFETLPCPGNCDNNNITSNNITNISNKSSSNPSLSKIPYTDNAEMIGQEIRKFCWYDYYSSLKQLEQSASDRDYIKTYLTAVNSLIDMLCQDNGRYGKEYVNRDRLFRLLNDCVEEDDSIFYNSVDYTPAYNYSLRDLIFFVVDSFTFANKKYVIKKPKQYLKTLIWDCIKNYF